jgi:hypothetical protein
MLVPDYDASDAPPVTEQIASSYEDVAEDAPWKDIVSDLRPDALHAIGPTKFIRTGPLQPNLDIKTYDAGNLFLCTIDGTAVSWGKLWVEYDVTLMTPQLNPAGFTATEAMHIVGNTPTSAAILGAAPVIQAGSTPIVTINGPQLVFQEDGKFLVVLNTTTNTSATETTPPTLSAGASFSMIFNVAAPSQGGSSQTNMIQQMVVNVLQGTILQFSNTLVGGQLADCYISRLPASIV